MSGRRSVVVEVATSTGPARLHVDHALRARRLLVLGHGAGGGVEAVDLVAAATRLPQVGTTVVRFEQPWRVAGRRVAVAPPRLDEAWVQGLAGLPDDLRSLPLVVGGRSAGARVACRTAAQVGALGVVGLAFPLHPPGRPQSSRVDELTACAVTTRVVQGGRDTFGTPAEFPESADVQAVPGADHGFAVSRAGPLTAAEALDLVVEAIGSWLAGMPSVGPGVAPPC